MEMYWPFWGRCRGPTALALRRSAILRKKDYQAAQGVIRICPAGPETLETRTLINRYRTIPNIDFGPQIENFHSLNGANLPSHARRSILPDLLTNGSGRELLELPKTWSLHVAFARRVSRLVT
jgi:hypothetical protein